MPRLCKQQKTGKSYRNNLKASGTFLKLVCHLMKRHILNATEPINQFKLGY